MPARLDLAGKTSGLLTIVKPATKNGSRTRWSCRCQCGALVDVQTSNLTNGHTRGCGSCTRKTHGESRTPLYKIWAVRVCSPHGCCEAWRTFEPFKKWALDNGWQQGLWVHRKADQGIYEPDNCFIGVRRAAAQHGTSKNARLLPAQIVTIRQMITDGLRNSEIAARFKVHRRTISDIRHGKTWR